MWSKKESLNIDSTEGGLSFPTLATWGSSSTPSRRLKACLNFDSTEDGLSFPTLATWGSSSTSPRRLEDFLLTYDGVATKHEKAHVAPRSGRPLGAIAAQVRSEGLDSKKTSKPNEPGDEEEGLSEKDAEQQRWDHATPSAALYVGKATSMPAASSGGREPALSSPRNDGDMAMRTSRVGLSQRLKLRRLQAGLGTSPGRASSANESQDFADIQRVEGSSEDESYDWAKFYKEKFASEGCEVQKISKAPKYSSEGRAQKAPVATHRGLRQAIQEARRRSAGMLRSAAAFISNEVRAPSRQVKDEKQEKREGVTSVRKIVSDTDEKIISARLAGNPRRRSATPIRRQTPEDYVYDEILRNGVVRPRASSCGRRIQPALTKGDALGGP